MSFFERNRDDPAHAGIDPERVPPGQYLTDRFPVLHAGVVPEVDLATWAFTVDGRVAEERRWTWDEFRALPSQATTADIHCVTKWSKLDTRWEGTPVTDLWSMLRPLPEASHVLVNAYHGFTANLSIEDFVRPGNLFAHSFDGRPLAPDHGYPLRLVVPHLYFWKSVKWVRGFTVLDSDRPGFWERNGYHMHGDPWAEQRFWGD
ncbi:MAG: sulfite oxidase-like oxidoreductase [Actinobacteria bacterium]|nr:MAG: sulfite oxidase-like oxidoreductase [Actinomycetota bacterium]